MLQIFIDGSDVTSHVIEYTREKDLCSSEGLTEILLDSYLSITTYDVILAYENGNLKGTFYIDFIEKSSDGTMNVHGRDNSKRAQDYFIADRHEATGDTSSRYWIELFLGEAGISYNFNTIETGYIIQEGEFLGLSTCAEIVEMLVRYSGWYIYYDQNNVAQIGKIDYDATNFVDTFTDTEIVSIVHNKNDQYLRNRAVVWGAGYKGDQEWTFADVKVDLPWMYDSNDERTILARAGFPIPFSQAMGTVNVLLNEYARLVEEKTIELVGFHDIDVADVVLISSQYYTGVGLVSQINVRNTDAGMITTIVLDRRCPRFVGFYNVGGKIYAGTDGDGVWTKPLNGPHTWTDYSTGLSDLFIKDLDASYGVLSTVTDGGYLYGRTVGDDSWIRLQPSYYYDTVGSGYYPASSGIYVASIVSDLDQSIYGLFTISGSDPRTWITRYPAVGGIPTNIFVTLSGETKYEGIDIEVNYEDVYLSVLESSGQHINAPFGYNPEGQEIEFTGPTILQTKTTYENTNYDGWNMFAITGNHVYRFNNTTKEIKRINYMTDYLVAVNTGITDSFLWFIPNGSDTGYLFTYGYSPEVFISVYKVDWEEETFTFLKTEEFVGYSDINGIIGAVNDGGTIRAVFGLDDGSYNQIVLSIFDCDTENFSSTTCGYSDGEGYVAGHFSYYSYYPFMVSDVGDGLLAFWAFSSDNKVVFLDTNTLETTEATIPYTEYELYGVCKMAPDFSSKCVYVFAENNTTDDYNDSMTILKVDSDGSYSVEKAWTWSAGDYDFNYEMAYGNDRVIAVHSNGMETIFYDCKNHIERAREYTRYDSVFAPSIGPDDNMYEVHADYTGDYGPPTVELYDTSIDPGYYGEWKVVGTEYGTNGVEFGYSADEGWHFILSPVVDDFTEHSLVRSRVVPGTSTTVEYLNRDNYLEDNTMYMITSTDYYMSNANTNTYSTGFTIYGMANLGTQPGVGKHGGPTLEDCYAAPLDLGDFSTTPYARRASPDGNHGEIFIWYGAGQTGSIGIHHGDRLDWSADNSGELTVNVYKYVVEDAISEVYYDSYLKHPLTTSNIYVRIHYKRIGTSTFRDTGVRPFVELNGTRYYENTLYSSTYTRYRTFNIDLGSSVQINSYRVGYEVYNYGASLAVNYITIQVELDDYNYFSIDKVHPNTASRQFFKDISILAEDWGTYNYSYLRAIGNYLEFSIDDYSWETYPRTTTNIMCVYDNVATGNMGKILRYRNNSFEEVYALAGAHFNLDISTPNVITAYTRVATSGIIYIDGDPYQTGSSRGDLFFSFAGDSFRHINLPTMSGSYIFDSRGFTIIDDNNDFRSCIGFVTLSGLFGSVGQLSYVDVTEYEDTGSVIVFPDIHDIQSFTYVPVALETTNYNYMFTPTFLVGLSGTVEPFLQRDADTEDFFNASTNFPSSRITTIRVDDMV